MKKLSLLFGAVVIAVAGLVSAPAKQVLADQTWQPEVLVSSSQVRFEAQVTGYDSATNKYKYKFSWLMPKGKTYSFKIDGNMYQSNVTQNAVIESPYWFSPDITYTIQIYPMANGRGTMLAQGSFKAPSAPKVALTEEEEYELFFEYLNALPEYKSKTVKSTEDVKAIIAMLETNVEVNNYSDLKPFLSKQSVEVLDQLPLLVQSMNNSTDSTTDITKYVARNFKVQKGNQYAYIKQTIREKDTKELHHPNLVFIKEDGQWKLDYLQYFKEIFIELGVL
jgi:hypothetical protein